ncbi:MAG: hypothetical protein P8I94_02570 [Emcibacteraceae bacterium]|nr:hypothetical protein [Emcibacteraceae bacterium]
MFDWRSPHTLGFNFRHDLTDYGFSYGFDGQATSNRESNDIRYNWTSDPEIEFNAFAEYILFDGIKMRLEAENINTKK